MDSREHKRFVVDREVEIRINGRRESAFIYDLSSGGCMLEGSDLRAYHGDHVVIKLANIIDVDGKIAWMFEHSVGIKFDVTVPETLVQHLGFKPSQGAFDDFVPRDRFGRALPCLPSLTRTGIGR